MPVQFPPSPPGAPADQAGPGYVSGYRPLSPDFATQVRDWVDIVVRGRWIVLVSVLIIAVPAAVNVMAEPDVYQADARLYVESKASSTLEDMLPGGGGGVLGDNRAIKDELYILQNAEDLSEAVARRLLDGAGAEAELTVLAPGETPSVQALAGRVESRIRIRQDGDGVNAVAVSATSEEPTEAALLANLYAQAYVDRTQSSSRASVTASRAFLEAQADSVSVQLAEREEAARQFMDREGAVRLDDEASNIVSQLAALEAERDEARVALGMETSRVAELQAQANRLERNLSRRLGSTIDRELQQDEARLSTLRERLETIYLRDPAVRTQTPPPAEVAELQRQIMTLERRIRSASDQLLDESLAAGGVDAAGGGLTRLSALRDQVTESQVTIRGLRSRIEILNGRIGRYQRELDRIPGQSVELARLIRQRESAERLALGLGTRLQEARVAESAELGYAEMVRRARTPWAPVAPNRPRTIVLSLLLGLGLGVVLAVARARLDQSIRRPDHLRALGYPVLGVVPDTKALLAEAGDQPADVGGITVDPQIVTLLHPLASATEAFRGLRTNIQFARPDSVIETLLITSPSPGEGKSTVAANLAVVMAQAGRRTLLLDADLRRPRIHRLFGLNQAPGLTDRLLPDEGTGRPPLSLPVTQVADLLDVLPAGNFVPNPAEYLGSKAFRDLLASLRETYDFVVVDAPPVMAATDPVLLSTQVDTTAVVALAGGTKDFQLRHAVDEIQAVGASVAGVVLNRFDVTKEYGYRYQYQYKYGSTYSYGGDKS